MYPIQVDKQVTITAAWFHDKPLEAAAPLLPRWWLIYVSLVAGAALGWFFEANLFTALAVNPVVGRAVTAVLIGGGTRLLHKVINQARAPVYPEVGL